MEKSFKLLHAKYPFLTHGQYLDKDILGIVQNSDNHLISMYVYDKIKSVAARKRLLMLGEAWWWESNRKIPINMFLPNEMREFKNSMSTFIFKDFIYMLGPQTSIDNMSAKRVKRRNIQLIRKRQGDDSLAMLSRP